MSCKQCKFEFCWKCLGETYQHRHKSPNPLCPMRQWILLVFSLILIVLVKIKLCLIYDYICMLENVFLYNILAFGSANVMLSTLYVYKYVYQHAKFIRMLPVDIQDGDPFVMKHIGLVFLLIFVIVLQIEFVGRVE